ncbi:MAG: polyhydroxyalkanoate depolymerase [Burkholderiales bacterium]
MLYSLHELQKSLSAPFVTWAQANHQLFSHPHSLLSHTPMSRQAAAGNELFVRLLRNYDKPEWRIGHVEIRGEPVDVRIATVMRNPFCHLLRFEKDVADRGPPLLIFAPLSGHFATLLRDTVRTALRDYDVYITDWMDARMVPQGEGTFHLDDYVRYCQEFIRHLGPGLKVMSVCQPTVPVLAAVALMAQDNDACVPKAMVMMGGPIDARRNPTKVNELATKRSHAWFEKNVIHRVPWNYPGRGRSVYPGFLQHWGFLSMNADRHVESHRKFFNHLVAGDGDSADAHRRFYDEYNAVLDMPAEYYLDTIKTVFQEFALPRGQMTVGGRLVEPAAIRQTSLFTIEGELDDISGNGQTLAAHDLCTGIGAKRRRHLCVQEVGHYGIFSGRRFRESIYPEIREFLNKA